MNPESEPAPRRRPDPDPDPSVGALRVEISDTQACLDVNRAALAALVRDVLCGEEIGRASISIALVDDATIHALNRRHLDHDWPTDVITFRLSEPGDAELAAELVLSAEMAATTAAEAGVEPRDELALYLVHGLLHLCGHDDRDAASSAAMRRREAEVLSRLGIRNTFEAPARVAAAGAGEGLR